MSTIRNLVQPKKFVLSVKFSSKFTEVASYLIKFVQKISREITTIFSTAVIYKASL